MDLLECQDISFGYDRKAIIDRLSFTVKKGEIFAAEILMAVEKPPCWIVFWACIK